MKRKKRTGIWWVTGMLAFSCFITAGMNGRELLGKERIKPNIEELLPNMLAVQISDKYRKEAIEAQAVIARSNFYSKLEDKKNIWEFMKVLQEEFTDTKGIWKIPSEIYREATEETKAKVLTYYGEVKQIPYHELSAGKTRNGKEVFHDSEYEYLISAESNVDKNSSEFLTSVCVSKRKLPKDLKIKERDSAGYVLSLDTENGLLEGESFAYGTGLPSSNFIIQKSENQFRFVCKGKGHGLGFSQYGGNELAKAGKSWKDILNTYFPEMEISNYP